MSTPSHLEAHRIIRGFQWTYVSVALQGILKLAALMLLARLLTPRDFGLLSFALLCTNFVERIAQGGIGPVVVQFKLISSDFITTAWWLSIALGICSTGLVSWSAGYVAVFFGELELASIIQVLSIGCILEAIVAIPEALLQRELRCREIMFADNLAYLVAMLGVCSVLALSGCGVWSLVVAHLVLKALRMIVIMMNTPRFIAGGFSMNHARHIVHMGLGFSLGRLLNFFSLQGDNFIVGRLLGTVSLGMYNRAYQLMALPAMYVGQVFERVMFPAMARRQSEKQQLARDFLIALEVLTLVALPVGVVLFVLAEEVVLVGFGEQWRSVIPVVSILAFGVFFRTAYKCSDTVVRSIGAVYRYALRQALYATLVMGGAGIGALVGGILGVACGVVIAVALNYVSMTRLSSRLLGVSLFHILRAHLMGLWASVCVGLTLMLTISTIRASTQYPLIVLLEAGVVVVFVWGMSVTLAAAWVPFGCMRILRIHGRQYIGQYVGQLTRSRTC